VDDFIFTGSIDNLPGMSTNKKLLVLFLVDATKSMEGQAISQVNVAIQELVSDLKEFGLKSNVDLKLAIMSFTNSIRWEMQPTDIQTCYDVQKIETRPGLTQYGVIYHELNRMMKKGILLEESGKQAAPVLILLTDGAPSDDYQYDLTELKKNGYFALSNRSAVIMGEAANDPNARAAVAEFASNENQILTTGMHTNIVQSIKLTTLHTLRGENPPGPLPDPGPGTIPDPGPGPFPDPGPGPIPDPGPLPDPGPGPIPDPDPGPLPDPDPGPFPDPGPGPIPDPGPGPFPDPGPGPIPEPGTDPFPDPGPLPDPEPGLGPFPDPGPLPDPEPGLGPFPDPGPGSIPEPGTDPFPIPEPGPGPGPFPDSDPGPVFYTDPGSGNETGGEAGGAPGADPGGGTEPLSDPFQDPPPMPGDNADPDGGQDTLTDPFSNFGSGQDTM
jgi:uncharacterized protein YegL